MKKTIKDAYVYDLLNLDSTINMIGSTVNPKLEDYKLNTEEILNDIKHKSTVTNKHRLIKDIQDGNIILISAPGITLPAWCMQSKDGNIIAVSNLFSKIKIRNEDEYRYQIKEVLGLIIVASVLRNFFINEKKFIYNNKLITDVAVVYSRMIMRVIDTMFSINSMGNEQESQFIEFMLIKFFYKRVMETSFTTKEAAASAYANVMRKSKKTSSITYSIYSHSEKANAFPEDTFDSIDNLCKALAGAIPSLSRLETNVLIRKLIFLLGEKSVLMLESPQYLMAYLTASAFSTNLIKDFQISNIAGSDLLNSIAANVMNIE